MKKSENDVVIVSAVRTPFGRFDGALKTILSMDLGVYALKEVVRRINLDPQMVDEVYYGTCIPAEYAIYTNVPARQITLLAGFPESNISLTIDRACCSSLTALRYGYRAIKAGEAAVCMSVGSDNMPRTPHLAPGQQSVGTMVNVRHLAATPLGATVTAHAELIAVDGRRLTFKVSAHDGTELIGEGMHERALIDLARFEAKVKAKAEGASV